jgi:hypothetical protein
MYGRIAIVDLSEGDSGYTDEEAFRVAQALDHQIRYHVQKAYRYTASPVKWLGSSKDQLTDRDWPIYVFKDPDVADALGYHDVDPDTGMPYGRVFSGVCRSAGVSLSSVLSHEVIEAFVDPYCNDWSDQGSRSIAHEACDPVQNSSYDIYGIEVSNFVKRSWFNPSHNMFSGGNVDYLGHLKHPFDLEAGGYLIVMQDGRVSQVFGEGHVNNPYSTLYRQSIQDVPQPSRSKWRTVRELTTTEEAT